MNSKQLFKKTMPFIWAKLLLGAIFLVIAIVSFALLGALGFLFGGAGLYMSFCIWLGVSGTAYYIIMHYFGYMVKAAHVAVIAEATATGVIPDNQVEYGKNKVKERFAASNGFFVMDRLISGAVKQLQRAIGKIGDLLEFIPGMGSITSILQSFIGIALGYIDECCLGWVFRNPQDSAFKSAADGVVIYTQNWKVLLKSAFKTLLKTVLLEILIAVVVFIPIGAIFRLLKWSTIAAIFVAIFVSMVVKFAVMDSFVMIEMMLSYMQVAPSTQITYDLYGKLCGMSRKFKNLFDKGQEEQATMAVAGAGAMTYSQACQNAQAPVGTQYMTGQNQIGQQYGVGQGQIGGQYEQAGVQYGEIQGQQTYVNQSQAGVQYGAVQGQHIYVNQSQAEVQYGTMQGQQSYMNQAQSGGQNMTGQAIYVAGQASANVCSQCGTQLNPGMQFCTSCGNRM